MEKEVYTNLIDLHVLSQCTRQNQSQCPLFNHIVHNYIYKIRNQPHNVSVVEEYVYI